MTIGVGGSTIEQALAGLQCMTEGMSPIPHEDYLVRLCVLQASMQKQDVAAVFVNAGSNLEYFTGVRWHPSERLVGALLTADGSVNYLAPAFEEGTVRDFQVIEGPIHTWEEHESPYALLMRMLESLNAGGKRIGLCPTLPFSMSEALRSLGETRYEFCDATPLIVPLRQRKSAGELALMQRAKDMTLCVQQAAASILHEGITAGEVSEFIRQAHRRVGAAGSTFCIVLFGADSAFPHGVREAKPLEHGDMVLIDTGCALHGYQSDITRSYVFGEPSERQRRFWEMEKRAQLAAFAAARPGATCESIDLAARASLEADGLGPGYCLPGLPHRTGHGIGLDIHESPYLVRGDSTRLAPGMCFSNEPMICVPGEFGIRLEDHFYMTEQGPRWFTQPSHSIDDPFALG